MWYELNDVLNILKYVVFVFMVILFLVNYRNIF